MPGVRPGHERHDGGGADGDVLAATEHAVDEATHEGGVETVLGRKVRHCGVGDPCHGSLSTSAAGCRAHPGG